MRQVERGTRVPVRQVWREGAGAGNAKSSRPTNTSTCQSTTFVNISRGASRGLLGVGEGGEQARGAKPSPFEGILHRILRRVWLQVANHDARAAQLHCRLKGLRAAAGAAATLPAPRLLLDSSPLIPRLQLRRLVRPIGVCTPIAILLLLLLLPGLLLRGRCSTPPRCRARCWLLPVPVGQLEARRTVLVKPCRQLVKRRSRRRLRGAVRRRHCCCRCRRRHAAELRRWG